MVLWHLHDMMGSKIVVGLRDADSKLYLKLHDALGTVAKKMAEPYWRNRVRANEALKLFDRLVMPLVAKITGKYGHWRRRLSREAETMNVDALEMEMAAIGNGLFDVTEQLCRCRFTNPETGDDLGDVTLFHGDRALCGWLVGPAGTWKFWYVTAESSVDTATVNCNDLVTVAKAIGKATQTIVDARVGNILNFQGPSGNILIDVKKRSVTIQSKGVAFKCQAMTF
jgi:hypothetical protein